MATEEQIDEIEALKSIFDKDFTEISSDPPCFMIKLTDLIVEVRVPVTLKITLPTLYPSEVPQIEVPNRSGVLSKAQHAELIHHLNDVATCYCGMVMVFLLIDEAKQWFNYSYVAPQELQDLSPEEDITDKSSLKSSPSLSLKSSSSAVTLSEPKVTGGAWDVTVGLVGKPSSGKSTFFNAATNQYCHAKTAAHPFTTIEPNIGKAFYSIPCPCQSMAFQCNAAYGHNFCGERLVPVVLKDVAGLVPGASEGRGKGNRFLNDLCDADLLIHVVDASGCTDENGEETTGYDPLNDIAWLFDEIHLWIYGNIMDKWVSIRRNPAKLVDMFTGYHASKALIHAALDNAGVDANWSEDVLHRIVKEFLKLRFPIFIVLNKADTDTAQVNIARIQETCPKCHSLPVSAEAEVILQGQQRSGVIEYHSGDREVKVIKSQTLAQQGEVEKIQQHVLNEYGSTNVHHSLCEAIKLRSPAYTFPVSDLDTLTSIDKFRGENPGKLRDCLTLKPYTTVEEVYNAMLHYPHQLIAGDFVRAECLENGKKRIMRKDELITEDNSIIKIMTTRKASPVNPRD